MYLTPKEIERFEEKESGSVLRHRRRRCRRQGRPRDHRGVRRVAGARPQASRPATSSSAVDGKPTKDAAIETSIARIKGKEGTHGRRSRVQPKDGEAAKDAQRRAQARIEIPETQPAMIERPAATKVGYVQLYEFGGARRPRRARATSRSSTSKGAAVVHPRPALQRRRPAHAGGRRDRRLPDAAWSPRPRACTRPRRCSRAERPGGHRQAAGRARQRLLGQRLRDRHRRAQGPRARRRSSARSTFGKGLVQSIVDAGQRRRAQAHHRGLPHARTAPTSTRRASRPTSSAPDEPKTKKDERCSARCSTSPARSSRVSRAARRPGDGGPEGARGDGRRATAPGAEPRPRRRSRTASPAGASSGRSSRCSPTRAPTWSPRAARRRSSTTSCSPCRSHGDRRRIVEVLGGARRPRGRAARPAATREGVRAGLLRRRARRGGRGRGRAPRAPTTAAATSRRCRRSPSTPTRRATSTTPSRSRARATATAPTCTSPTSRTSSTTTARSSARRAGARPACTCRCSPSPCCRRRSAATSAACVPRQPRKCLTVEFTFDAEGRRTRDAVLPLADQQRPPPHLRVRRHGHRAGGGRAAGGADAAGGRGAAGSPTRGGRAALPARTGGRRRSRRATCPTRP